MPPAAHRDEDDDDGLPSDGSSDEDVEAAIRAPAVSKLPSAGAPAARLGLPSPRQSQTKPGEEDASAPLLAKSADKSTGKTSALTPRSKAKQVEMDMKQAMENPEAAAKQAAEATKAALAEADPAAAALAAEAEERLKQLKEDPKAAALDMAGDAWEAAQVPPP